MGLSLIFFLCHPLWRLLDFFIPKSPTLWAFATHHLHTDRFIENQRALFEYVKSDPNIRKIVFYRGPTPDLGIDHAVNYEIARHGSIRGLYLLLRCKTVFLTHSISMDYSFRWGNGKFSILKLNTSHRLVVNLWHGIPLKRLLYAANEATLRHTDRIPYRSKERQGYAGLIASSDIDSYAMGAMFYPLNYRQIWITGLPRNDFLSMPEENLPSYIKDSIQAIRRMRQGKRLIIYAPTYRQTSVSSSAHYYQFSPQEIDTLKAALRRQNAVLGYRPHYFKNSRQYFNLDQFIDNELIFDMSQKSIPEFSALARECDLLITDYSSVYIEALYLSKPVISFAYDIEHYKAHEDGLLYDMSLAFPGPVLQQFGDVITALESRLSQKQDQISQEQEIARKVFFRHQDSGNAHRVSLEVFKRLGLGR